MAGQDAPQAEQDALEVARSVDAALSHSMAGVHAGEAAPEEGVQEEGLQEEGVQEGVPVSEEGPALLAAQPKEVDMVAEGEVPQPAEEEEEGLFENAEMCALSEVGQSMRGQTRAKSVCCVRLDIESLVSHDALHVVFAVVGAHGSVSI